MTVNMKVKREVQILLAEGDFTLNSTREFTITGLDFPPSFLAAMAKREMLLGIIIVIF